MCQLPRRGPTGCANLSSVGASGREEPAGRVTVGAWSWGSFPFLFYRCYLTLKVYFPFLARSAETTFI